MPTNRPRRHSLSSGDESLHPHPAKAGGLARRESRRRARLPRSKSTSNVFESLRHGPGTPHQSTRSVALEQANTATLRELAEFLRTTGPPPERPATHDECLRLSGSGEPRRWSLQSFRRNKRTKLQRLSLQSHLPGNVVPGTTAGGHPYIAISTPVPKNEHVGGPWFRSQYPVFLPESQSSPPPCRSGPKVWPERSSSKAAIPSSSGKSAALGDIGSSPRSAARAIDKNLSPRPVASAEGRSRALANRVSTDHLLRAMLNPVDGIVEHDVGVCLKKLGSRKVPGMEQPQVQAQRLVAVYEEASHQSETPQQATITHTASPPRSSPDERRRESPSVSPAGRNPSRSLSNATRQLTNISIHGGLAVPKENVPPESPGFPNMLAAINFPSPPKSSRPSSPASPTPSVADVQVSTGSRPIIQRRTSSRRTYVSTSVSAASLDQVVMQKRPSTRCKNSDGPADVSITGMNTSESSSGSSPPTARAEYPNLLEDVAALDNINTASMGHVGSNGQSRGESTAASCNDGEECQGEWLASQLTATTDSSRQSSLTRHSSDCSSASDAITRSKSTVIAQNILHKTKQASIPSCESIKLREITFKSTVPDGDDAGLTGLCDPDSDREVEEHQPPNLMRSITSSPNSDTNSQSRSILERRLARKAKVREYKLRHVDASRVDMVDSPVLGYFPPNLPREADPTSQYAFNSVRRPSALSVTTTASEASNDLTLNNIDSKGVSDSHQELALAGHQSPLEVTIESARTPNIQLKISPVVATDIEPIYPTRPHWHTSGITMSPIMVVADVESRPGSPTLRAPTLMRPESPSPRPLSRLKPLMVSSHTRQKSHTVTISRNPATGAIERTTGPVDPRFNRRSLITMPTPPMSPEAAQLPKRFSLPPVQLSLPVTPRERASPSRRQEWHSSPVEGRETDSKPRSVMLKERVMREKLQKEKEITDIVAKTVGLRQKQSAPGDEPDSPPSEQGSTETLEKRLQRLERTNDAWLCAMKPLLETMARTLEDMRVDDRCRSLRMSDFVIDMEAEATRVSHSRRGENGYTRTLLQGPGGITSGGMKTNVALDVSSAAPLRAILQKLDSSPVSSNGAAAPMSEMHEDLSEKMEAKPTLPQ